MSIRKIIVLGSGPAEAIPRPSCKCPTCQDARKPKSKSKRTRSSILLLWHKKNILIDCGPDFKEQIKREKIKKVDAILLTHAHADAAGGLKKLQITNYKLQVFAEKQTLKYLDVPLPARQSIKPFKPFKLFNFLTIIPFRVRHAFQEKKFPTLGFKIGPLVYASDVSQIPYRSEKYFKRAKILFLDGAMWFDKKIKWHLNAAEATGFAKKFRVKKLYLTQIGHSYPPHKIAQREINKYCKKQKITFPVILAYDGLKINL